MTEVDLRENPLEAPGLADQQGLASWRAACGRDITKFR